MDNARQQLVDKLKTSNNILVTVSRNPSVDQLASCIGLTVVLNKLGKHSTAVFSGEVPSTIEFLKPEETLEKNTDSLRDFIISLDKNKADKLRYKVEDDVVRIFITPYKTSISQDDLEFSEGDFNVDVVVALGVTKQEDLDEAITAHGRILHDATVTSINAGSEGGLGTINWNDPQASSLSELATDLSIDLGDALMDNQVATSFMTGIVSETARFSNEKTSAETMRVSSILMAAGANQQLVASQLEEATKSAEAPEEPKEENSDGTIEIKHDEPVNLNGAQDDQTDDTQAQDEAPAEPAPEETPAEEVQPPEETPAEETQPEAAPEGDAPGSGLPSAPPPEDDTPAEGSEEAKPAFEMPAPEPSSQPPEEQPSEPAAFAPPPPELPNEPQAEAPKILEHKNDMIQPGPGPGTPQVDENQTLTQIEQAVDSPHLQGVDEARDEINRAIESNAEQTGASEPIQALNAQPLGDDLHPQDQIQPTQPQQSDQPADDTAQVNDPTAPPPVPPPIPFEFGKPPQNQNQK